MKIEFLLCCKRYQFPVLALSSAVFDIFIDKICQSCVFNSVEYLISFLFVTVCEVSGRYAWIMILYGRLSIYCIILYSENLFDNGKKSDKKPPKLTHSSKLNHFPYNCACFSFSTKRNINSWRGFFRLHFFTPSDFPYIGFLRTFSAFKILISMLKKIIFTRILDYQY